MTHELAAVPASQRFWDQKAPVYALQPIKDMPAYDAMLASLFTELRPSDRVLELGCGTGGTAIKLAQEVQHVTATDFSAEMIAIAKSKLDAETQDKVSFIQADAAECLSNGAFDAVFATSLLHLVEDVDAVLDQAFQQLKPGGLLITKTVCLKHTNWAIRAFVAVLTAIGIAPTVNALSQTDLEEKIEDAGFVIKRIQYFGRNKINPFIVAFRPRA